jgi:hypothetical protein
MFEKFTGGYHPGITRSHIFQISNMALQIVAKFSPEG